MRGKGVNFNFLASKFKKAYQREVGVDSKQSHNNMNYPQ